MNDFRSVAQSPLCYADLRQTQETLMRSLIVTLSAIFLSLTATAQTKTIAERLGHPADAKLLIIHADDLAVAHSEDAASFEALDKHAVSSASIMVPCP